ncbi:MAG: hypothetical protein ABI589_11515, partial [Burkholderiales bacterium]
MLSIVATVALFAAAQYAHAVPVIRDVGVTLNPQMLEAFDLDLDQNGTTDFTFSTALTLFDPFFIVGFDVVDIPFGSSNGVVIDSVSSTGFSNASRLSPGDAVSATSLFSSSQTNLFSIDPFNGKPLNEQKLPEG